jgi:outer membrane protein OmpA-like peptidoglycan-associated protein
MTWTGNTPTMVWNGSDDSGNIAANGSYTYVIESRDRGGNRVKKEITGIGVDSRPTPVYITASSPDFSPNGDGEKDTLTLTPYVELKEGIAEWSIEMIHPEKGVEKRFTGSGAPPASLVWNGMGEYAPAADGQYRARFSAIYKKGNTPEASVDFALDTEPPEVTLSIGPEPFSPDNDGVDDELYIDMEVEDTSDINSWKIEIIDPAGNIFTSYSGVGEPSRRIIWDGISDRGELVQSAEDYTLVMTIEDSLGNSRDYEKTIPVDVLVLREGNKLKIIISSIIFAPNTADFSGVEEEKSLKNTKTLRRLAQIFRKYSRYRIHIEGYAVMIHWDNPARAEKEQTEELIPLSKARAEAVKDALVELGIDKNRITTEGLGGSRPLVPHSDEENRWKNRRVEFILVK